jgi:SanA protein
MLAALLAMASFIGIAMNVWIRVASWTQMHNEAQDVPFRTTAIVLGASVFSDRTPTEALESRLQAALNLYEAKKVDRILISGSSESAYYDETGTMRRWLLERGVPQAALLQDDLGLRTLDSMVRAAEVFGIRQASVCTQSYHLPRALFWAHRAGIDAVGLDANAGRSGVSLYDGTREFLARIRAFADAYILGTEPSSLSMQAPP